MLEEALGLPTAARLIVGTKKTNLLLEQMSKGDALPKLRGELASREVTTR